MDPENFITWTLVIIAVFVTAASILIWYRSSSHLKVPLTLSLALLAVLCVSFLVEIRSSDMGIKLIANDIGMIPRAFLPLTMVYLAITAVGFGRYGRWVMLTLAIVMASLLVAELTNDIHGLFYMDIVVNGVDSSVGYLLGSSEVSYLSYVPGPLYRLFVACNVLQISMAVGILAWGSMRASEVRRGQLLTLTLAIATTLIPTAMGNLTGHANIVLCLIVGSLLGFMVIMLGFLQFEISDVNPSTMRQLAESSLEGQIVIDKTGVIVHSNAFADEILGVRSKGMSLDELNARLGMSDPTFDPGIRNWVEIGDKVVAVRTSHIMNARGAPIGTMQILADVTEITAIERALERSNAKLELLSRITRHDIMNQNLAIQGYTSLVRDMVSEDEETKAFLDRIARSSRTIDMQLEFAREYQSLGSDAPGWQELEPRLLDAFNESHLPGIELDLDVRGVSLMADMMLPRVIYNLFDNCKRHGKRVTSIHVGHRVTGDELRVYFEDDGVGVPLASKSRIFEIGEGENTGVGLFATREILAITGISIWEAGDPGVGARFVMSVPQGGWRIDPE